MEEVIVFVYEKDGKFIVNNGFQEKQLLASGYKHISTINACVFINNILNEENGYKIWETIKNIKIK